MGCHDQRNIFYQPLVITGALAVGILRKCQDESVATGSVHHACGHLKLPVTSTLLLVSIVADLFVQLPRLLSPLRRVLLDPPQPSRLAFPHPLATPQTGTPTVLHSSTGGRGHNFRRAGTCSCVPHPHVRWCPSVSLERDVPRYSYLGSVFSFVLS